MSDETGILQKTKDLMMFQEYQGINEQYDWKWDEILEALFSDLTDAQPPLFIPAGD